MDKGLTARSVAGAELTPRPRAANIFDFLRLVAASAVVVQHANFELATDFGWGLFELIDGVPMFFILSGMLIFLSAEKVHDYTGRWREFFANRYLRIAPALYLFAVAAPLLLVLIGAVAFKDLFNFDLVVWLGSFLFLVPGFDMSAWEGVGAGAITWPLYTIPAEISFYIITPFLVFWARKYGFWWMLGPFLAIAVAGGVAYYMSEDSTVLHSALNHTFLHQGACFALGIFWAKYWGRIPVKWWWAAIGAGVYLLLQLFGSGPIYGALKPVLIALPLSLVIVFIGYNGPKVLQKLTDRIGDLSFGTYIWHYLVIIIFMWWGLSGSWWQTALLLVSVWVIAALSWWGVEKRALRLKRVSFRRLQ